MFTEIKLTPFILFLLLLVVLLISIIYGSNQNNNKMSLEGLTDWTPSLFPLDETSIKSYSNPLTKLYGANYFDKISGNLIRLVQSPMDIKNPNPNGIVVYHRDSSSPLSLSLPQQNPITPGSSISSSYFNPFSIYDADCQIFYIPWKSNTYIHIIDLTTKSNVLSCLFGKDINTNEKRNGVHIGYTGSEYEPATLNVVPFDYDKDNNKINLSFGQNMYQLSTNILFNISNGYITFKDSNTVYDRNGIQFGYDEQNTSEDTSVQNINSLNTWTMIDSVGQTLLVYMAYLQTTLILLLTYNSSDKNYTLRNCKKFTPDGVDIKGKVIKNLTKTAKPTKSSPSSGRNKKLEDYYKWYWYWNTTGNASNSKNPDFSNDYLLKTQVVPPVCPSLPVYAAAVQPPMDTTPMATTPMATTPMPTTPIPTSPMAESFTDMTTPYVPTITPIIKKPLYCVPNIKTENTTTYKNKDEYSPQLVSGDYNYVLQPYKIDGDYKYNPKYFEKNDNDEVILKDHYSDCISKQIDEYGAYLKDIKGNYMYTFNNMKQNNNPVE